jgi:hypothetical protein
MKRCSKAPVVIVRAQYGLSTIVLIKDLPPSVMFAVQPSWTSRIHWREATPSFGPSTNEVSLQLESMCRVIGTKDAVLKITAAQKRTVTQASQYGGLLRGIVALGPSQRATFVSAGVLVMDNESLVNSNDAKNMMILSLALLQTTMGVQTSLTNFRGRVKFTRVVDATLNKRSCRKRQRHCQVQVVRYSGHTYPLLLCSSATIKQRSFLHTIFVFGFVFSFSIHQFSFISKRGDT